MAFLKVLVLLMFIGLSASGQEGFKKHYIRQDESIDRLVEARKQINQRSRGTDGFRIQIYTDTGNRSKLRTERMQAEFDSKYPHIRSYISYDEPYWKLRVGDFRTRLDAIRFLNQISASYQDYAAIVPVRINYPALGPGDTLPVFESDR